jgi:hypothetical protein
MEKCRMGQKVEWKNVEWDKRSKGKKRRMEKTLNGKNAERDKKSDGKKQADGWKNVEWKKWRKTSAHVHVHVPVRFRVHLPMSTSTSMSTSVSGHGQIGPVKFSRINYTGSISSIVSNSFLSKNNIILHIFPHIFDIFNPFRHCVF